MCETCVLQVFYTCITGIWISCVIHIKHHTCIIGYGDNSYGTFGSISFCSQILMILDIFSSKNYWYIIDIRLWLSSQLFGSHVWY